MNFSIFQVLDVHLVADPLTRESRGFGFITMSSIDEAENCIKYLNRSVLEGRIITVEKVKVSPSIFFKDLGCFPLLLILFFNLKYLRDLWMVCC